jgi:energy-coupling factor transporter ATP-binding protein EcfA2
MSAHAQIVEWSKGQPAWRRDALRRLLTGAFSVDDENAILELLKAEYKLATTALVPAPLTAEHISAQDGGLGALALVSLSHVTETNRLAPDQTLSFGPTGLTLVYGDNGSGKSGYARVLKRACRARFVEPIQNNVFGPKGPKKAATARFEIAIDSAPAQPVTWEDGTAGPGNLARIAVFDSKCASVYVDGDNQVTFIPYNLDCFERLGSLCDRLKERLTAEQTTLRTSTAMPVLTLAPGTQSHAFLVALAVKTDEQLNAAIEWNDAHEARLKELSGLVTDPAKLAVSIRQLHAQVKAIRDAIATAAPHLSPSGVQALKDKKQAMKAAREAADLAAVQTFQKEPLPGVGSSPWRVLFDAARAYSEQVAYKGRRFPAPESDARCVFCQQELDADARDRIGRFNTFVTGEVTKRAEAATRQWDAAISVFRDASAKIVPLAIAFDNLLKAENAALRNLLVAYITAAVTLRAQIEQSVIGEVNESVDEPPPHCIVELDAYLITLNTNATVAEAAIKDANAVKLRNEFAELQARKLLHENKTQIEKRLADLRTLAKLGEAIKACNTTGISQKGTELIKQYVTGEFDEALTAERKALGIGDIPLRLVSSSAKGSPKHQIKLDKTTFVGNTSLILSEGEHRAVALASFMAEQTMVPGSAPIVIDDPVSSLDHERRGRVARRLMEEAAKRQVIVFTHDLLFYMDTSAIAVEKQIPLTKIAIQRGPKGCGTVDPTGDPWTAKTLGKRRAWLDQQLGILKKVHDAANAAEYEAQARSFYDHLRETWERLIEEGLFANVIVRYRRSVETRRLTQAVLDDALVTRVYAAMATVSEYTAHDRPTAAGASWPNPTAAKEHLDELISCVAAIDAASKAAEVRRKKLEKAPAPAPVAKAAVNAN